MKQKVLISYGDIPKSAVDLLSARCKIVLNDVNTKESLLAKIGGSSALLWGTQVKLDKDLIEAAGPRLKIVATASAGYDHIDVAELKKRNIQLSHTPGVVNTPVSEIAILLALAAGRRLHEARQQMQNGAWIRKPSWMLGREIAGSTVGIVGLGGVGQSIVAKLKSFSVKKFLYCGHQETKEGKLLGAEFVSFDTLLPNSDFVIASCPLTPETKGMFNEKAFKKMKKSAIFVNVARGGIVNQPDLIKALKKGTIFAAGLDVMIPEPLPEDDELLTLPNCVLTPHLGCATAVARKNTAELAAENIIMALSGKPLLTPVSYN